MNDKLQCCKRIFEPGSAFKGRPCYKPVKVTVDGKHYCATHSPDAVAKRRAASDAKHKADLNARNKAHETRKTEQHKAACFDELVQALDKTAAELTLATEEMGGLPHSLGYSFTHINKMEAAVSAALAALDKARNV